MKYNLERLGWFNFERLIATLLKQVIGPGVSSFSGSADQGRDATFQGKAFFPSRSTPVTGEWVFQVKYRDFLGKDISAIRRELKQSLAGELKKVLFKYMVRCDVYVLITNCPLTAENKDELKSIMETNKGVKSGFVLGGQDVEELLDINPKVVRAFPQIMGVSQLRELVNWGINQRSIEYLCQVQEDLDTFVVTGPYLNALEVLQKKHFCVLTGAPKMGKTCTGDALAAAYAADGFSVYELRAQKELYDVFDKDERQLFVCDDVFGDIALQADRKDDWTRSVTKLLRSLDKSHKLVWTARNYILKEAIESSRLREDRPQIDNDTVVVSVENLSQVEKAMILYNHAKKANLPIRVKDVLKARCEDIVGSEYFAPESIRQLCTGKILELAAHTQDKGTIEAGIFNFLRSPGVAWKKAFRNAPSGVQSLCIQVMAEGGRIPYEKLKSGYEHELQSKGLQWPSFADSFRWAEDTFVRRKQGLEGAYVSFYHPSMRDLLVELIQNDAPVRKAYVSRLGLGEFIRIVTSVGEDTGNHEPGNGPFLLEPSDSAEVLRHLREEVVPSLTLKDANTLLSAFASAIDKHSYKSLSEVGRLALVELLQAVTKSKFWEMNYHNGSLAELNEWLAGFLHIIWEDGCCCRFGLPS